MYTLNGTLIGSAVFDRLMHGCDQHTHTVPATFVYSIYTVYQKIVHLLFFE